ncbi:hypothetical protein KOW79_021601 [Hemibagrus wyckioides]|uniref:Uncharacterized protein n=1 Tax=Hemibagrus wyckioides TaxID=337641 RepID=A0A9D3SD62_9TELE|nr:hypothetical protein KOW79_021601 [Hemibagrus wyckioides]
MLRNSRCPPSHDTTVIEPILQLLPTEPHEEPSAVILPLDAGELISAWCNIQFLSAQASISQFKDTVQKETCTKGLKVCRVNPAPKE